MGAPVWKGLVRLSLLSSRRMGARSQRARSSGAIWSRCGSKWALSSGKYAWRSSTSPMLLSRILRSESPERFGDAPAEVDDFGVEGRVTDADRFDAELRVLAESSGLRSLVAEDRQVISELDRLAEVCHAMLEVCAADRRGAFGPQGEPVAAAIFEDVHLFFDDVGAFADSARE